MHTRSATKYWLVKGVSATLWASYMQALVCICMFVAASLLFFCQPWFVENNVSVLMQTQFATSRWTCHWRSTPGSRNWKGQAHHADNRPRVAMYIYTHTLCTVLASCTCTSLHDCRSSFNVCLASCTSENVAPQRNVKLTTWSFPV